MTTLSHHHRQHPKMPNNGEPQSYVNDGTGTTPSANRPTKRAKIVESGVDLVGAFERATQTLADAIKTAAVAANALPDDLF
jgi:hypothetical protein